MVLKIGNEVKFYLRNCIPLSWYFHLVSWWWRYLESEQWVNLWLLFHNNLKCTTIFLGCFKLTNQPICLFQNKSNLVTPRNGELLIAATQDFITGAYLLTQRDNFLTREEVFQLAATLLAGPDTHMDLDLPPPAIRKVSDKRIPCPFCVLLHTSFPFRPSIFNLIVF